MALDESFYLTFWHIKKEYFTNATLQFFKIGWILLNYNSTAIILHCKPNDAVTMDKFRPIALANFKLNIIYKIIDDKLSIFMPSPVSKDHKGFIKGRCIMDFIYITSEATTI